MKKLVIRIGIAVAVLLVACVAGLFFFLGDAVKKGVETFGPPLTKTEVRLASARISPLSGSGHLGGLFVGNPEGFRSEYALKVADLRVDVDVGTLLADTIVIETIHIQGPELTFEGSIRGSNLSRILDNIEAASAGDKEKAATGAKPEGPAKKFRVKEVAIVGGKLHLSVKTFGGTGATIPLSDIHLNDIGSDGAGVTLAQLSEQILEPMVENAIKAYSVEAGGIEKVGKSVSDGVEKAVEGIKGVFKK